MNKRVCIVALIMLIVLSGCGEKRAEEVTDYGQTSSSGQKSSDDTEEASSSEENSESKEQIVYLPEAQEYGTPVWEDSFAVGDVPITISINTIERNTDLLRSYRSVLVTEDMVREEEVIRLLFGDTAEKLTGKVGDYALEDRTNVHLRIAALYVLYHPEVVERTQTAISIEENDFPLWLDEENGWYHLWQGKYQGSVYQLLIGYDRENGRKDIELCPLNPGEAIGKPEYARVQEFSGYSSWSLGGSDFRDIMKNRENETKSGLTALRNKAGSFAEKYLCTKLWEEDIEKGKDDEVRQMVFVRDRKDPDWEKPENMRLDGYELIYRAAHTDYGSDPQYEWYLNDVESTGNIGNIGSFQVTDAGVLSCSLAIWDEPVEELAEATEVLSFDTLMKSFREQLIDRLDVKELSGYELSCTSAGLIFYPVSSNEKERTYIPAWRCAISGRNEWGRQAMITAVINAIDGEMISLTQEILNYN